MFPAALLLLWMLSGCLSSVRTQQQLGTPFFIHDEHFEHMWGWRSSAYDFANFFPLDYPEIKRNIVENGLTQLYGLEKLQEGMELQRSKFPHIKSLSVKQMAERLFFFT